MITGSCFCNSLRYKIDGALQNARACHCSKCRKVFSGASSSYAEVAEGAAFHWLGDIETLSTYTSEGDWAIGFCARCGSTLCGIYQDTVHGVTLGSVDGDPGVEIAMHLYVDSKAPWDCIGGDAPKYRENTDSETVS